VPAKNTAKTRPISTDAICIRGARQHNLKNLDLDIPLGKFTVITGPSGSGKSSLAFHTLYAEGQRRYVETFSPYVRQFLDRMDKPAVDRIDGIPPAIAIEQKNTIRTTRSTVGTLTELNDYLKLLFPHLAEAFDPRTGEKIKPDSSDSIATWCMENLKDQQAMIVFPVVLSKETPAEDVLPLLSQQGYARIYHKKKTIRTDEPNSRLKFTDNVLVVQDRLKITSRNKARLLEAIGSALTFGKGHLEVVSDTKIK
jgi:excinuclease ABC subunit A